MNWEKIKLEKFNSCHKLYENADCIYKERWTIFYARVTDIQFDGATIKAKVSAIPIPGLTISGQTDWEISSCWSHFSFLESEYWHSRLWTIYFNRSLIEEVIALAASLSELDQERQWEELVKHISFKHGPRINQLEVAEAMYEDVE